MAAAWGSATVGTGVRWALGVPLVGLLMSGCTDDRPGASGTTVEVPDTTTSTVPDGGDAPMIATFELPGGERYSVELATPDLVEHAEALLAGEDVAAIPNGLVVREPAPYNEPWSWHIDPASLEFAFVTIEVCDGIPSDVERGNVTSDHYCPWSATVVAVDQAPAS